jgi:hypothetical protein
MDEFFSTAIYWALTKARTGVGIIHYKLPGEVLLSFPFAFRKIEANMI